MKEIGKAGIFGWCWGKKEASGDNFHCCEMKWATYNFLECHLGLWRECEWGGYEILTFTTRNSKNYLHNGYISSAVKKNKLFLGM